LSSIIRVSLGQFLAQRKAALLWLLPLGFLALFFFFPLFKIGELAFYQAAGQALDAGDWLRVWRPLGFTLWQAALSTALTLLVGLPAAYVFGRFNFPGKSLMRVVTTLPFILPTVVVAASLNALLGPRGWLNLLLMQIFGLAQPPLNWINSLEAILLAHVFYNTTVMIRLVGSAWARLDPRLEHAGRTLGASSWRTLWQITLPLLRPTILAAGVLVFLFNFTSFGVILLLGGPRFSTLEVEIYVQAMNMFNLPLAGVLSLVQMFFTLLISGLSTWLERGRPIPLMPRLQGEATRAPRTWKERGLVGGMMALLSALLLGPLAALVLRSFIRLDSLPGGGLALQPTLAYYQELFINRRGGLFYVPPVAAGLNSLGYALATVIISLTLGLAAAYALQRRGTMNRIFGLLLMLPLGASAVTLGLGFLAAFNGTPLEARSFALLLPIAHSLVALPLVVRSLSPALASIPPSLRQGAAALGASPRRVWREIDWPVILRAALIGAVFAFTISLGEFGASSFLARSESPTLPVAIFRYLSQPGELNYGQSLAMSTILMLVCAVSIFGIDRLEKN
jgi:thiamine transport system permease protein